MLLTEYNEAEAMKLFELDGIRKGRAEGRAEGRVEGRAEGENKMADLMQKLFSQGRVDDAQRAASDQAYREELFKEFQIN